MSYSGLHAEYPNRTMKIAEQQEIERQTQEFLAKGGKINVIEGVDEFCHGGSKAWDWQSSSAMTPTHGDEL